MPLKKSEPATEYEEINRWDEGVGWIAHPDETMLRASHALDTAAGVWAVDPVDAPGVDDLFAEFGDVAGVVVLLNRHYRDADEIARRHDVPVYVPAFFDRVPEMEADLRRFDATLPGTDYRMLKVADAFGWEEAALYDEAAGTLVVAESVGNAPYFTTPGERIGVHPMMRLTPPSALKGLRPERVLVGHGRGAMDDATRALDDALGGARRQTPKLYAENLRMILRR
ncbi:hypothetical protein [Halorussus salinus]|uniref:hypothetical protein n=1 Tax=Halorussus salinus TaxID=1364935 RepID=UPI00109255A1|nr:hypothetical protein [Halorussus salinus]